MNREQMTAMFDAFNRHAIDDVMEYFADDVVFDTVSGNEAHGTRIVGKAAVRDAFVNTWTTMPDVQWAKGEFFFADQRVVSECTFMATQPDGLRVEADSVDLFTLEKGKITRKQAFRKQRPAFTPAA